MVNNSNCFDIAIVGAGIAGAFALQKIMKNNKGLRVAVFDIGRPPMKRRHSSFGFLGGLPGSDGKLYLNNIHNVSEIAGHKRTTIALKWVMQQLNEISDIPFVKDKKPSVHAEKRIKKHGFDVALNNYYQVYPRDIHGFSRAVASELDKNDNVSCSFDNEVFKILKHKAYFSIITNDGEFQSKKILIAVGRGGWRWASELFSSFGIIENNDMARFGIKVEVASSLLKDFNQSNCTLTRNSVEVGPLSWSGTVLPEDHLDLAIAAFRSNENRWLTDKVSFNFITEKYCEDNAYQQVERIGKLTFILGNDRIMKERLSTLMNKKSKLSVLPEYSSLLEELEILNDVMPGLLEKGSFYAPCLHPYAPTVKLDKNFSTVVDNMYVAGESANIPGILGAAVSGAVVADQLCR